MIAVITESRIDIFRRTTAKLEHCWTVEGSEQELKNALRAARRLMALAKEAGDWSKPGRFGLDALEPVPLSRIGARVLAEDDLDS